MEDILDGLKSISLKYNNSFTKILFDKISACKNLDELNICMLGFNNLVNKLNLDRSNESLTAKELSIIDRKLSILTDYINAYNSLLKKEEPIQSKIKTVPEKEIVSKKETKVERSKTSISKKVISNDIDYNNSDIQILQDIENKLLVLKSRLSLIDQMSDDAINIRVEINRLSDERLHILEKYRFDDSNEKNGALISRQLDSLELRYVYLNGVSKTKPVVLNTDEYIKELNEVISKISDLSILGLKSKYLNFDDSDSMETKEEIYSHELNTCKKKYYDLIISLFGTNDLVINIEDGKKFTTNSLLHYLTIFNINDDFSEYKDNAEFKIGSDVISKQEYSEWVKRINVLINCLMNKCKVELLNKSNKVQIEDTYSNKDSVLKTINTMLEEIYTVISNGEKNVHR